MGIDFFFEYDKLPPHNIFGLLKRHQSNIKHILYSNDSLNRPMNNHMSKAEKTF